MNLVKQCKTLFGRSPNKLDDEASIDDTINKKGTRRTAGTHEVVSKSLVNLKHRFHKYLRSNNQESAFWASVWITEEAILEANHVEALLSSSSKAETTATSPRIQSYLKNRKDRTLDFLWSSCRDGPVLERQELEQLLEAFLDRETRLLKIYLVSYIKCDSVACQPSQ